MNGNKPLKPGHWLLLLTPALELMIVPLLAKEWGRFLLPHAELPEVALLIYNLIVALALSMALGMWWARHLGHWSDRTLAGLLFGVCIALMNGMIAFAGCTAGNSVFKVL